MGRHVRRMRRPRRSEKGCFKCGSHGHQVKDCPQQQQQQQQREEDDEDDDLQHKTDGEAAPRPPKRRPTTSKKQSLATKQRGAGSDGGDGNKRGRRCLLFLAGSESDDDDQRGDVDDVDNAEATGDAALAVASAPPTILSESQQAAANELQLPPSRRKLVDEAMSGFLIGNTFARALLTTTEAQQLAADNSRALQPLKFLWIGVGDVRNPLSTLLSFPRVAPAKVKDEGDSPPLRVELHLNDVSSVVLARDVALLSVVTAAYTPSAPSETSSSSLQSRSSGA